MGSTISICNATNIILNLALAQIGPLYYENKVLPGECWKVKTGKSFFTVNANFYTGEDNIYTDWSVAKPIIETSLYALGFGTFAIGGAAGVAIGGTLQVGGVVMDLTKSDVVKIVNEKLSEKSPGWDMTNDRTIYVKGGPPASAVNMRGSKDNGMWQKYHCEKVKQLEEILITKFEPADFKFKRYVKNDCKNC